MAATRSPSPSPSRSRSRSKSGSKSRSRSRSRSVSQSRSPSRSRSYSRSQSRSASRSRSRSPHYRSNRRSRSPQSTRSGSSTACFFVGNLPFSFTDASMYDLFSKYGPLKKISFPYDRHMGRPKGFAFVEYQERRDAEDAFHHFNGKEVEGRQLRCDWDSGKKERKYAPLGPSYPRGRPRGNEYYPPPPHYPPYPYDPYAAAYYPPSPALNGRDNPRDGGRERNNPVTRDPNYREPPYERKSEGAARDGDEPRRRVYMA